MIRECEVPTPEVVAAERSLDERVARRIEAANRAYDAAWAAGRVDMDTVKARVKSVGPDYWI